LNIFTSPTALSIKVIETVRLREVSQWIRVLWGGRMSVPDGAFWRQTAEGDAVWLLGGLYSYKARGRETNGVYSLFEVQGRVAAPRHFHQQEEEGFYVAQGEILFQIGDEQVEGSPGTFAFAPRGVEHSFRIESPEAKLLLLVTPGDAGHESLFEEMGEPAENHVVPPPPSSPPDVELLAAIAARHGTTIVGPPIGEA
jgi:quercetin dioxygenase-like cupin family protein